MGGNGFGCINISGVCIKNGYTHAKLQSWKQMILLGFA
jgi:hypothetical protein